MLWEHYFPSIDVMGALLPQHRCYGSITSPASMLWERADRVSFANSSMMTMAKHFLYCRSRTVAIAVILPNLSVTSAWRVASFLSSSVLPRNSDKHAISPHGYTMTKVRAEMAALAMPVPSTWLDAAQKCRTLSSLAL